jgi:hypothetical protein
VLPPEDILDVTSYDPLKVMDSDMPNVAFTGGDAAQRSSRPRERHGYTKNAFIILSNLISAQLRRV